jgi:hypothetical protein
MDESTTTEAPVDSGVINGVPVNDQGMAVTQPEPTEPAEAENAPETPIETPQEEPSKDDNSEWLKSKGIEDLSTPEGQAKLVKSAREAEKLMHEKTQRASELEKSVTTGFDEDVAKDVTTGALEADDPRIAIRKLEIKQNVRDFFDDNPEAKPYEAKMIEIVAKKPWLKDDLESLYANALKDNVSSLKSEGGKEALETLAAKQSATAPRGSATNGASFSSETKITPQNVDAMVGKMSTQEYKKRLPEINAALAG